MTKPNAEAGLVERLRKWGFILTPLLLTLAAKAWRSLPIDGEQG